jgi:hypothetical protein
LPGNVRSCLAWRKLPRMSEPSNSTHETPPPPAAAAAILGQIAFSRAMADSLEQALRKAVPALENVSGMLLSQRTFEAIARQDADLKTLLGLFGLVLKFKQQALAERKFELLSAKLRERDPRRRRKHTGGLTPETLRQIEEMAKIL